MMVNIIVICVMTKVFIRYLSYLFAGGKNIIVRVRLMSNDISYIYSSTFDSW